jgi:hypothetical protein
MTASPAQTANAETAVYLERDNEGRYLPTINNYGRTTVLADINSITAPAVSPNSTRIAFSGSVGDGSIGRYAIFVVDANGSNLTRLTDGKHGEFDPVWVNNGQSLVFSQNPKGRLTPTNCCRLVAVDISSGQVDVLTPDNGAQRPAADRNGSFIFYDNPRGVWRIRKDGTAPRLVAPFGYDAAVSNDEDEIVFLHQSGSTSNTHLRRVSASGGTSVLLYSTSNQLENPVWVDDRIYFVEHAGLGYDGRGSVTLRSVSRSGGSVRFEQTLPSGVVGVTPGGRSTEMFFYRDDGLYRYYPIRADAGLDPVIRQGSDYTSGWSSITSVNTDGGSDDEMFFYRADGLYRYYDIRADASLGAPFREGDDYTSGWDAITAVDLGGDGQDEMFFYRSDGLYRYYNIRANGRLGSPIRSGDDYTSGWDAITAVDLDGDGQDEMFFYRADGLFRYYDIRPNGRIGAPIRGGDTYTEGWDSITAVDLDRDGQDEMFFYREDGLYRYYDINSSGRIGSPIRAGNDYTKDWTSITSLDLPAG